MNKEDILLAQLAEECGEVVQAVGKALRFGLNDRHPKEKITNVQLIYKEVHDIVGVFAELQTELGMIDVLDGQDILDKREKVKSYLEVSENLGRLDKASEWVTTGTE